MPLIALRLHNPFAQRILLAKAVIYQEVGGVDFAFGVMRRGLGDAFAQELLEVGEFGAEAVCGPEGEEAGVVVG